jgi:hypothetical protein
MRRRTLLAALAAAPALAHEYRAGDLHIDHPFTRATARAGVTAAGYMVIRNGGAQPDRLIAAESPAARVMELHTMSMEQGVMRMRPVPAIDVPAGGEARLAPGGLHLMFIDTTARFERGQRIAVTLVFERAGRVPVEMAVEAPGAGGGHQGH